MLASGHRVSDPHFSNILTKLYKYWLLFTMQCSLTLSLILVASVVSVALSRHHIIYCITLFIYNSLYCAEKQTSSQILRMKLNVTS